MGRTQYGLVLLVAMVAGLSGGVAANGLFPPQVIQAKRFEVVRKGKRLAVLDRDGLVLAAERGWIAALHADGGPELVWYDGSQKTRAVLSATAPNLTLSEDDSRRADLALWPQKEPPLRFFATEEKVIWSAPELLIRPGLLILSLRVFWR